MCQLGRARGTPVATQGPVCRRVFHRMELTVLTETFFQTILDGCCSLRVSPVLVSLSDLFFKKNISGHDTWHVGSSLTRN